MAQVRSWLVWTCTRGACLLSRWARSPGRSGRAGCLGEDHVKRFVSRVRDPMDVALWRKDNVSGLKIKDLPLELGTRKY